jgi:hypothetical protein
MADYRLVDHGKEQWGVELTSGEYKGVVVSYNSVSFDEEYDDDTCLCSFRYSIIEQAGHNKDQLENSNDFINELGDTLQVLISDSISHSAAKEQLLNEGK